MEKVYLAWLWKLSGSPATHLINFSALLDKLFHPRHRLYISVFLDMPEVAASGSNSSLMDADDMLHVVESDESLWQRLTDYTIENISSL